MRDPEKLTTKEVLALCSFRDGNLEESKKGWFWTGVNCSNDTLDRLGQRGFVDLSGDERAKGRGYQRECRLNPAGKKAASKL